MKISKKLIYIIIAVILLLLLEGVVVYRFSNKSKAENKSLIGSLNAELTTWKDKDSLNMAKIEVIETEKTKNFTSLKLKEEENIKLQTLVKKYEKQLKTQGSATIFQTETKYIKEEVIQVDSTCGKCSFVYIDNNPWINTIISVKPGNQTNLLNFGLNFKIKNEYEVIIGQDKKSLFKKGKSFAEVKNLNPYTETTSLRTYQVSTPKLKRWGVGPQIGFGLNSNFTTGAYVGIGLHYSFFNF